MRIMKMVMKMIFEFYNLVLINNFLMIRLVMSVLTNFCFNIYLIEKRLFTFNEETG